MNGHAAATSACHFRASASGVADNKKRASEQPGGLSIANDKRQAARRCSRSTDSASTGCQRIGQPLQGLALLADARVLIVVPAGHRRDRALIVALDGVVEAERDD